MDIPESALLRVENLALQLVALFIDPVETYYYM